MIRLFLVTTVFTLALFTFFHVLLPFQSKPSVLSSNIKNVGSATTVSLSVGEYHFTLFGYASPQSLVTIEGMGIFDQTYADDKGYFEFENRFSPYSPREACLTAQDQFGRLSTPVCLPPFPTKYDVTIGPVIMPPTLSLDKNNYFIGDEVKLTGQTIPNTEVDLSMFTKEKTTGDIVGRAPNSAQRSEHWWEGKLGQNLLFFPQVQAATIPQLQTKSDNKGNFSIALPSSFATSYKLFAKTNYEKEQSPQSLTLSLKILPIWMIVVRLFLIVFEILKSRLLEIVILGQLGALSYYFLRRYLHPHVIARNRAIILREKFALQSIESESL